MASGQESAANKSSGSSNRHTKNNQELSTSKSLAPSDRPSFTFIDHDDDLTSKRIKDANARKAIRSHVMRDVRRRERLAGLKRTPKRENRGTPGASKTKAVSKRQKSTDESRQHELPFRESSTQDEKESTSAMHVDNTSPGQYPVLWTGPDTIPSRAISPQAIPKSWFFDPFCTLPGASEMPSVVDHLISHVATVFIPMTFPVEHKAPGQVQMSLMVASALSDPGSFFGLMSMSAAHRAILAGRHGDLIDSAEDGYRVLHEPDYYVMKARCIREMNAKVQDPKKALSNEAFDTIINLLCGALIVGLFDEARVHLKGLRRMVELRGGITNSSLKNAAGLVSAIQTCDIKTANGLQSKPIFPLAWVPQPLPPRVLQRITPPPESPLHQLGTRLMANSLLSSPLKRALQGLHTMMFFDNFNRQDPQGLTQEERQLLRMLMFETEHELASYYYRPPSKGGFEGGPENLHPVEVVARISSTCFINLFFIVSPPSSGMGRALTNHLKNAIDRCVTTVLPQLPSECYDLVAWALLVGAHGAAGQPERPWFVQRLTRIIEVQGWRRWEDLSGILTGYFYAPSLHDMIWQPIWNEAMSGLASSHRVTEVVEGFEQF